VHRNNCADANINSIQIGERNQGFEWRRLEVLLIHQGLLPLSINPVVSSRPNIKFMFCTACPAAPLTKLSIAVKTTSCRPRAAKPISQKLVVLTQLMSGLPSTRRTKNDSR